jgi:hypothetical protein
MTSYEFALDTHYRIRISFPVPDSELSPFVDVRIELLVSHNQKYMLDEDCIMHTLEILQNTLALAIDNKLETHESIDQDLGFLWNEELQHKSGLTYKNVEGTKSWVGLRNLLYSPARGMSTWLYNKNKKIFLEVAPIYRQHRQQANGEKRTKYKDFVENYQPLLIVEIDKEKAIHLLNQIKRWFVIVAENYRSMHPSGNV